jgi:hypothetical protein
MDSIMGGYLTNLHASYVDHYAINAKTGIPTHGIALTVEKLTQFSTEHSFTIVVTTLG